MTQEKKQILLQDLCARLPYGVIVQDRNGIHHLTQGNTELTDLFNGKCNIKPYLRPLTSMTEKEKDDFYYKGSGDVDNTIDGKGMFFRNNIVSFEDINYAIDWLNAHHFDYRGLIEKGLALEAPKEMYKTN